MRKKSSVLEQLRLMHATPRITAQLTPVIAYYPTGKNTDSSHLQSLTEMHMSDHQNAELRTGPASMRRPAIPALQQLHSQSGTHTLSKAVTAGQMDSYGRWNKKLIKQEEVPHFLVIAAHFLVKLSLHIWQWNICLAVVPHTLSSGLLSFINPCLHSAT